MMDDKYRTIQIICFENDCDYYINAFHMMGYEKAFETKTFINQIPDNSCCLPLINKQNSTSRMVVVDFKEIASNDDLIQLRMQYFNLFNNLYNKSKTHGFISSGIFKSFIPIGWWTIAFEIIMIVCGIIFLLLRDKAPIFLTLGIAMIVLVVVIMPINIIQISKKNKFLKAENELKAFLDNVSKK